MKTIPFLEFSPELAVKERVTKVTLFHLDGSMSEMKLTLPVFSCWSESQELGQRYIGEYVEHLTVCFLKIHSYQISLGQVDLQGNETYSIHYEKVEIPLNKVFVPAKRSGTWQNPASVLKRESDKRRSEINKRMKTGRNAVDGSPVKSRPARAGLYLN